MARMPRTPRLPALAALVLQPVARHIAALRHGQQAISAPSYTQLGKAVHSRNVLVLAYETNLSETPLGSFLYDQLAEQMRGLVQPEILGQGTVYSGWSFKHQLAIARMRSAHPDDLVVLTDYADVVLNPGASSVEAIEGFVRGFEALTEGRHPDAVVISAEAQCCVGALARVRPGQLVDANGSRVRRACRSGLPGCQSRKKGTKVWFTFQTQLAQERGATTDYRFLNAGLIAGRAGSLAKLLEGLQLEDSEDDQAVMTDLYFRRPELFVLDYNQTLFANARWPLKDGCVFSYDEAGQRFVQRDTGSTPLFLHTPGHYYSCLRTLAARLGWTDPPLESGAARLVGLRRSAVTGLLALWLAWGL